MDIKIVGVVGAGTMGNGIAQVFAQSGFTVRLVDVAQPMLDRARELTNRVARADLRALPFDAMSIDVVVCGLALGDFAELELALMEIARITRPGGCVIYSVVHPAGEAEGWSRTFESDGRQLSIDGCWHSLAHHRQACEAAGLIVEEWREPELSQAPGKPALLVIRARR